MTARRVKRPGGRGSRRRRAPGRAVKAPACARCDPPRSLWVGHALCGRVAIQVHRRERMGSLVAEAGTRSGGLGQTLDRHVWRLHDRGSDQRRPEFAFKMFKRAFSDGPGLPGWSSPCRCPSLGCAGRRGSRGSCRGGSTISPANDESQAAAFSPREGRTKFYSSRRRATRQSRARARRRP